MTLLMFVIFLVHFSYIHCHDSSSWVQMTKELLSESLNDECLEKCVLNLIDCVQSITCLKAGVERFENCERNCNQRTDTPSPGYWIHQQQDTAKKVAMAPAPAPPDYVNGEQLPLTTEKTPAYAAPPQFSPAQQQATNIETATLPKYGNSENEVMLKLSVTAKIVGQSTPEQFGEWKQQIVKEYATNEQK